MANKVSILCPSLIELRINHTLAHNIPEDSIQSYACSLSSQMDGIVRLSLKNLPQELLITLLTRNIDSIQLRFLYLITTEQGNQQEIQSKWYVFDTCVTRITGEITEPLEECPIELICYNIN